MTNDAPSVRLSVFLLVVITALSAGGILRTVAQASVLPNALPVTFAHSPANPLPLFPGQPPR